MTRIAVNRAFRDQRITGQQRYATEISNRLLLREGVRSVDPPRFSSRSSLASWVWVQSPALRTRRGEFLLSLTSRAPLAHPRQLLVVHDLFVLEHPEWFSRRYAATHSRALRAQLASAAAVIAVSEPTLAAVQRWIPSTTPSIVAPNGVTLRFSSSGGSDESARLLRSLGIEGTTFLLAVGSLDPRKNLRRLLAAHGSLDHEWRRRHPLVLVGGGGRAFRSEQLVAQDHVVHAGYVDEDALAGLYRAAHAVVVPSLSEGFGLPVVEAIASGTQVVLADIPAFRWVHGSGGSWFDPLDTESIARALERVSEISPDPAEAAKLAAGINRRFDWDESADAIEQLADRVGAA